MQTKFKASLLLVLLIYAFASIEISFKIPKGWPQPIYNFENNPLSSAKITLGRQLFHDPILSRDSSISCVSCHLQYSAFTHIDHDLSHGIDGRVGTRNSPALMNLAWHPSFMWDGSVNHLDMQALAPIEHPAELDSDIKDVVKKLQQSRTYVELFKTAFGDENITGERVLKALSQFQLTFVSANSKYDKVMRKEVEFTEQEANGYKLFKANCITCHQEPLFSNFEFKNNGLVVDSTLNDFGRMRITKNPKDSLKFKVPTLRNIEFSPPYMHDGRFKKLSQVMKHYTKEIQHSPTLAPELQTAIELNSRERIDLIAFLLTLTDKEFLFNKEFRNY